MLDEPLSNPDARMRLELRIEFRRLHKTLGRTLIYVTHDQVEALSLADRVAILHEGRLQQVDRPERIYDLPANRFVAEFIGSPPMNLIPAQLRTEDSRMRLTGTGFALDVPHGLTETTSGKELWIGVRAEAVRLDIQPTAKTPFEVRIRWIEDHGNRSIVHADLGGTIIKAAISPNRAIPVASPAWSFTPRLETLFFF